MRSVWITRTGPPEVLEVRDGPEPTPGHGEVLVRMRAAGINFADVMARLGLYPDAPKLPCVVGYEVAGTVERVGSGVSDVKAGYVQDSRPQPNPNKVWGLKARPGNAKIYLYPKCEGGKVVADVVRLDKGHTEGLEPRVTEEIVKLMMAAR